MISVEEAAARIQAGLTRMEVETVSLAGAHSRILAEDVISPIDVPQWDNSSMDGYAVRAQDLEGACASQPISLPCVSEIPAGYSMPLKMAQGECIRIFTGSPMPEGADAVVMQEETRLSLGKLKEIEFLEAPKPWENVRLKGEDLKRGEVVLRAGERLHSARIAVLAAIGLATIPVSARPKVAVLATGTELIEPGELLKPGQIYESNRATLAAAISALGCIGLPRPLVVDRLETIKGALEEAFAIADVVVTSGGVSVGDHDLLKPAFEAMGGKIEFWKVAMKPGKPFVFGKSRGKYLFGLPGNPVSAMVGFHLLVRPALMRMMGAHEANLPSHPGMLTQPLANRGDRRHFVRVTVDSEGKVTSAGAQSSHMLHSLAKANGLVDVPAKSIFSEGQTVRVLRTDF